ncbi:hypothetical protein [Puniceibacterium sp. IMCC21224]|uniref:hypothetical protein n=1 Tax=Puniceibacterium sp. IMCC21224 TaxID=1618204 RepID=UPI00350ECCF0
MDTAIVVHKAAAGEPVESRRKDILAQRYRASPDKVTNGRVVQEIPAHGVNFVQRFKKDAGINVKEATDAVQNVRAWKTFA